MAAHRTGSHSTIEALSVHVKMLRLLPVMPAAFPGQHLLQRLPLSEIAVWVPTHAPGARHTAGEGWRLPFPKCLSWVPAGHPGPHAAPRTPLREGLPAATRELLGGAACAAQICPETPGWGAPGFGPTPMWMEAGFPPLLCQSNAWGGGGGQPPKHVVPTQPSREAVAQPGPPSPSPPCRLPAKAGPPPPDPASSEAEFLETRLFCDVATAPITQPGRLVNIYRAADRRLPGCSWPAGARGRPKTPSTGWAAQGSASGAQGALASPSRQRGVWSCQPRRLWPRAQLSLLVRCHSLSPFLEESALTPSTRSPLPESPTSDTRCEGSAL